MGNVVRWLFLGVFIVGCVAFIRCLTGCGGDAFGGQGHAPLTWDEDASDRVDTGGESAAARPDAAAPDAPVADAGATLDAPSEADAVVVSDWQFACFGGQGQPMDPPPVSTGCTAQGADAAVCAGCAGTYAYRCTDWLPPVAGCSQWTANHAQFCCMTGACLPDPVVTQKCYVETGDMGLKGYTCARGAPFPCGDGGASPSDGYQACCP